MSRIAVVTGGTGFIGWSLCERLRDDGVEVRAVVRPSSRNPLPDGIVRVDVPLDATAMAEACTGAETVFHLAGLTRAPSYDVFHRVNAEGARQAALAARAADAFFLLVSSQAAAGPGTPEAPRFESDPPEPVSPYGRSKLAGEQLIAAIDDLRYAIARPPGVYGPRDQDFLTLFSMANRGLLPIIGRSETAYTLVHVIDVIAALRRMADAGVARDPVVDRQIFFMGYPEPVRQIDMVPALRKAVGRRVRCISVPSPILRLAAEFGELGSLVGRPAVFNRSRYRELTAPGFVCSVKKIEDLLGIRAEIDIERGFAETAAWYRDEGWL